MLAGVRGAAHRLERPQRRIAAAQAPKITLQCRHWRVGASPHEELADHPVFGLQRRPGLCPRLPDADKAKVQKLRADGEAAHKAGKHDDSMKLLAEAKKTLGI
jgi:hypothetical protein